jgi:antitoxin component HigA of HigAB toxin-antitoxin module
MQITQVVSDADYTQALIEIGRLIVSEPEHGTPEGDRLEALTSLAEVFEANRYVLDLADIERR